MTPEERKARAQVAGLSRAVRNGERPEGDLEAARKRLREVRAEGIVRKLVDQAPPLSDEQRVRLAELLRPARQTGGVK